MGQYSKRIFLCPFFTSQNSPDRVVCEAGRTTFYSTAESAGTKVIDKYADTYCCADWQRCTLARALIEFYEREDCGNGNHE